MSDNVLTFWEFARPGWLWCALPLALWLLVAWRYSLATSTVGHRVVLMLTRATIWVLLLFALAGLSCRRSVSERYVVVAADRSASIDSAGRKAANEWIRKCGQARGRHRLAVVPFAKVPGRVSRYPRNGSLPSPSDDLLSDEPDSLGTSIADALSLARASIPLGYRPQIVLLSDGEQTHGDALATAQSIGAPISTVVLPDQQQPETQVSQVRVPGAVKIGAPFDLEATITTNRTGSARLELYRNDFRVNLGTAAQIQLKPGTNQFQLRQQVAQPQTVRFTVRIVAEQDTRLDDNQLSGLTVAAGKPMVLVIDRQPQSLDPLRWALEDRSIHVDVRPVSGMPDREVDLMAYDAIALSNVSADQLSARQLEWLRRYVQQFGGGLLMFGSENSFGLGGYYRTPLEEVLPVRSDLQQEAEKPSLAMMLVIDRSGSMGGLKIQLAKDAAQAAVELLGARDQIGIVAFDDGAYQVAPMQVAANKSAIMGRISRLAAAGGTNMYPALVEARKALAATAAKLKHVIVLGDGISAPADFESEIARMVEQRITVTTVALGEKADRQLLRQIAQQGGGRYYQCEDPRAVPQVFARETVMASKSAIKEDPFLPQQVRATSVLRGVDIQSAPLLLGHVLTRPKATSELVLVTESGAPLLAWWRTGLGMALAWTSDAKSRWAAEWLAWPDFSTFWSQCFRHVMKQQVTRNGQLRIEQLAGKTRIILDLVDRNDQFANQAQVRLAIARPGSREGMRDQPAGQARTEEGADTPSEENAVESSRPKREERLLPQIAPGRYAVDVSTPDQGGYFLDVLAAVDGKVLYRESRGMFVGYPEELRLRVADRQLMRELAQRTGGAVNPDPSEVWRLEQPLASQWTEAWPWLVAVALLLLLADVALRRFDWVTPTPSQPLGS